MSEFAEKDKWVCPNDRELALRAKLQTGWSVKTGALSSFSRQEQLNDSEQELIVDVIKRADMLEQLEKRRVGRLVDRLENMKRNALGNGTSQCVLCANEFGLLSGSPLMCYDCRKAVCSKCSVDTYGAQKEQIWLCKICSETREMWKKSGAWFYRGLPNYIAPEKTETSCRYGPVRSSHNGTEATSAALAGRGWHRGTQNEKDLSDSSEDESKAVRVNRRVISRKALYDSTDSDSSASPRMGSGFPLSPDQSSERLKPEGPADSAGTEHASDLSPSRNSPTPSVRSYHSDMAPWRQRQLQREKEAAAAAAAEDEDSEDAASAHRFSPYLVEDRSADSLGSIGGTGRYVSAHPPRSSRRELLDVEGDDASSNGSRADSISAGTLEFSLLLLNGGKALKCIIHRAKELYGTDYSGFSDPFVRVQLLPSFKKGDTKQTKTLHKTVNPEFNETLVFHADSTIDERKLKLTVLDDYRFGSCALGSTTVPLSLLTPNQMCWLNAALDRSRQARDEASCSLSPDRPRVLVSLMHASGRNQLIVGLVRCVRLMRRDRTPTAPFVRLNLKPDAGHPGWKTTAKKKTADPEYNEELALGLQSNGDLAKHFLQITAWDKDSGKPDEYLGKAPFKNTSSLYSGDGLVLVAMRRDEGLFARACLSLWRLKMKKKNIVKKKYR
ncbi:rabphilin-3A isoform X1 [Dermacentor andersoni]|uniref:rabphilin-3A isoform X1 n=1 Tax=Dermacentor andersoni TaxID=34620 RepID=UPI002415E325|nr:rabphilin-3A-like isoform X1 [Dermacentor andersoni]